jgi:hypothetical protein
MKPVIKLTKVLIVLSGLPLLAVYAAARAGETICRNVCDWSAESLDAIEEATSPSNRRR